MLGAAPVKLERGLRAISAHTAFAERRKKQMRNAA
jgi:hypothetical protein